MSPFLFWIISIVIALFLGSTVDTFDWPWKKHTHNKKKLISRRYNIGEFTVTNIVELEKQRKIKSMYARIPMPMIAVYECSCGAAWQNENESETAEEYVNRQAEIEEYLDEVAAKNTTTTPTA